MSDFRPLVSIVIPVYNGANYMREAIDSALAQTYGNLEVLVVNDGSRDNGETERIAQSYGDKIRYFAKKNGGVATALNKGIREMRGEYFSWLSHDDVYLPHKIERQIAFMDQLELYDAVLYSDYSFVNGSGRSAGEQRLPGVPPDAVFQYLYLNQTLHGCTLLIPKSAFDEVGMFPEHLKTTQDYDLWLRLCRKRPFVHQAEILIQGRQHEAQGSRVMPEHGPEIRDFYKQFLPDWLEIALKGRTPAEAVRQKQLFIEQLRGKGLMELMEDVCATAANGEELAALRVACAPPPPPEGKARFKEGMKRALRPLWRLLPEQTRHRIRALKNSFVGRHDPAQRSSVQRLDFTWYYRENSFGASESRSGGGSSLFQTRVLRRELPPLLRQLGVKTLLDVPCGDFNWMRHVDLDDIRYIGGDIVAELAKRNQERHGGERRSFHHLNAVTGPLPTADLVFCRDCFVHLPFADGLAALRVFKDSGAAWLLTTTFTNRDSNRDLTDGCVWRPLNLRRPPFSLPEPTVLLNEKCSEGGGLYTDKCLGLWDLRALAL